MRTELKVDFWKAKGVPHLNLVHQKTGMVEAHTKYAEACKTKLDLAGKKARQEALKNLKAKLHKLKTDYPEPRHPKLWTNYIRPVNASLEKEVKDYNDALAKFDAALGKAGDNIEQYKAAMNIMVSGFSIGPALWALAGTDSTEHLAFLASMALKKDPRWIIKTFIKDGPNKATREINLPSETRQKVWAAVNAAPTYASLMEAFKEAVKAVRKEVLPRFRSEFTLQLT